MLRSRLPPRKHYKSTFRKFVKVWGSRGRVSKRKWKKLLKSRKKERVVALVRWATDIYTKKSVIVTPYLLGYKTRRQTAEMDAESIKASFRRSRPDASVVDVLGVYAVKSRSERRGKKIVGKKVVKWKPKRKRR